MGNCQAAEAATVLIQHPTGRIERAYCSISACQVMASNPGHYVAVVVAAAVPKPSSSNNGSTSNGSAPVKHLKLLRPDDTLHIGHVYRLVSFEEVLREFASKKHVRLSKLLVAQKERSGRGKPKREGPRGGAQQSSIAEAGDGEEQVDVEVEVGNCGSSRRSGATQRSGQWRPALQSIAETGS